MDYIERSEELMPVDDKLAKLKKLTADRDKIDNEIASLSAEVQKELSGLLAGFGVTKKGKGAPGTQRRCGLCGELGHRFMTCPHKDETKYKAKYDEMAKVSKKKKAA